MARGTSSEPSLQKQVESRKSLTQLVVYFKTSVVSLNRTAYKKRHKTRDLAVKTVPKSLLVWKRKVRNLW